MKQAREKEIITMCIKHTDLEVKELSELFISSICLSMIITGTMVFPAISLAAMHQQYILSERVLLS